MKINKSILFAFVFIAFVISSCSTISVSHFSQRKATDKTRYANQSNVITFPLLVDLDIEDRLVSASFSGNGVNEEFAKSMAVANAIRQASADVIVEPFYDITVTDNNISATVIGHPAHYKNFRKTPVAGEDDVTVEIPSFKVKPVIQDKKDVKQNAEEEEKVSIYQEPDEEEYKEEEKVAKEEKMPAKEEDESAMGNEDNSGRLKTPCFIIGYSAMAREADARTVADGLSRKGFKADYLWIPDYDRAGKSLYKVYVGPFKTREEADNMLPRVKLLNNGAYAMQLK